MAALSQLTLGRRAEAVGLAWTAMHAADDLQPQLAFEWTLSTNAATRAHVGRVSDSVTDVMLSVQPVRLAWPVYQPWAATSAMSRP